MTMPIDLDKLVTDGLLDALHGTLARNLTGTGEMSLMGMQVAQDVIGHLVLTEGWRAPEPMNSWLLGIMRANMKWSAEEFERVSGFLRWLVSLDDSNPDSPGFKERQVITLASIISQAREVLYPVRQVAIPNAYEAMVVARRVYWAEVEGQLEAWENAEWGQRPWTEITAVLWAFEHKGAAQPGKFTARLVDAIAGADDEHRTKLATAYPELVTAYRIAESEDGLRRLAALVKAP